MRPWKIYLPDQLILDQGTTLKVTNSHYYSQIFISLGNSKHWGKWPAGGDFGDSSIFSEGANPKKQKTAEI